MPGNNGQKVRMRRGDPIPYRGEIPLSAKDDPWWEKPQPVADAHMKIFDFSEEQDRAEYNDILDMVAKQRAGFGYCEFHYCEDTGSWKGLVHWHELYKEDPESARKKKLSI